MGGLRKLVIAAFALLPLSPATYSVQEAFAKGKKPAAAKEQPKAGILKIEGVINSQIGHQKLNDLKNYPLRGIPESERRKEWKVVTTIRDPSRLVIELPTYENLLHSGHYNKMLGIMLFHSSTLSFYDLQEGRYQLPQLVKNLREIYGLRKTSLFSGAYADTVIGKNAALNGAESREALELWSCYLKLKKEFNEAVDSSRSGKDADFSQKMKKASECMGDFPHPSFDKGAPISRQDFSAYSVGLLQTERKLLEYRARMSAGVAARSFGGYGSPSSPEIIGVIIRDFDKETFNGELDRLGISRIVLTNFAADYYSWNIKHNHPLFRDGVHAREAEFDKGRILAHP